MVLIVTMMGPWTHRRTRTRRRGGGRSGVEAGGRAWFHKLLWHGSSCVADYKFMRNHPMVRGMITGAASIATVICKILCILESQDASAFLIYIIATYPA
ncbi:hypothetical protein FA13DRAFT_10834 [Coprinellus micaceus]|uniref:Uncharacterized protein n=1 Tax=Coprinellus micaceus TaxID=71717 RepID=A0A4Y7U012_COPMI|nr:hypothetical protein FA13DRAFT_10834 [Coprinellus micaceus]